MEPLGYFTVENTSLHPYVIRTVALNGRGYRTILIRPSLEQDTDSYLDSLGYEDSIDLYQAMNCHQIFILTIINRRQIKYLLEI